MALFLSNFRNKIDKKGRISVPSSFRQALAQEGFQGIVAYPSFIHPCIEACGMSRMERLSHSIDQLDPYGEERDAFAASILGASIALGFDGDGRITLPESLIAAAKLHEEAVFVGKGQTFEIWAPAGFEQHAQKARDIAMKARGSLRLSGGPA